MKPFPRFNALPVAVLAAALLMPAPLRAQTSQRPEPGGAGSFQIPLQFDFLNPGAKSKAMGGAFAGLADDATASFANPAGLALLARSEAFFEGRGAKIETLFLERGRLSGVVINEGTDTIRGARFEETSGSSTGLAFASGVYVHPSLRWSIAGYRHELVRVDQQYLSNGVFQQAPEEFTSRRDTPQEGIRVVNVTGYGASAAYRVGSEIAVGAGLALYTFDLDSRFRRFDTVGFLGPPNLSVELGRSSQAGNDTAMTPTFGALFGLSTPMRFGVMYRHGPSFTFLTRDGNNPERSSRFQVPHTLAVGASFRPAATLTLALEVTHVHYERLREEFVTDQARAVGREADFTVQSGTEFHVGAQYLPTTSYGAPKFRAGLWIDPDHSVQFNPSAPATTVGDRLFNERLGAALSTGKDLVHYTGGVGVSLSPRFEVNGGFDLTSRSRVISASCVIR